MFIEKYYYKVADTTYNDSRIISDIDRDKYMTSEYIKKFPELLNINNYGSTALLYAGGPASHHSDIRNIKNLAGTGSIVIKGQLGFNTFNLAKHYNNIEYVSTNANTCASSMYCIHEAKWLLDTYDNVIIYAEEVVDDTLKLLFKQLGIDLVCGDAVAVMHLTKNRTANTIAEITDTAWTWFNDSSPMGVSENGYLKVLESIDCKDVTLVKPHGTGTPRNDSEEDKAIAKVFPNAEVVKFKNTIGHTQGASALVELCMLLDTNDNFVGVCLASGLGAMYGCCKVIK